MKEAKPTVFLALPFLLLSLTSCAENGAESQQQSEPPKKEATVMALDISTSAFENGQRVPVRHTADGEDFSPPLSWSTPPAGTGSFTLICDDPDAPMGTWVHWVIFNIPADSTALPEGVPADDSLPDGSIQGRNSWGRAGYGGPSPPPGKPHRYYFQLYALDTALSLDSKAKKQDVLKAMEGHILAEGQVMGIYGR